MKLRYYITKIDGKMSKKMLYFCTNISFLIFFCYILIFTHFREIFFIKWCWNQGSLYPLSLCTLNLWTATPLLISLFIFTYITFVLIPISPARSRHSLLLNSLVFTQNSVQSTSQCKPTLQKTHLQSNFQQIKLEILMDFFTCCPYMVYLWSHVPTTVVFCLALFHRNDMFLLNHIWQFCCQCSSKAGGPQTTSTAFWQNKSGYVNYIWLMSLLPDSPMTSSEINIQGMTEPK